MPNLTIAPVDNPYVPTPSDQTAATVLATVSAGGQEYLFSINGASPQYIMTIPILIPGLEKMVAERVKQTHKDKKAINDFPQQIVLSYPGLPFTSMTVVSSLNAIHALFTKVITDKTSDVRTLVFNDFIKPYEDVSRWREKQWEGKGLKHLKEKSHKIKQTYFPYLTKLQLLVTPNFGYVFRGSAAKNLLSQLKTLEIAYSRKCQPYRDARGWLCTNNFSEIFALNNVYNTCLNNKNLILERLRLTLWTECTTPKALCVLKTHYAKLKTLAIDSVIPTAKIEDQMIDIKSPRNEGCKETKNIMHSSSTETRVLVKTAKKDDELSELDNIIKDQAKASQIECLEIYHWHPQNNYPVFAQEKLALYIANGWLPKLNTIAIGPEINQPFEQGKSIDKARGIDTLELLTIIIGKQMPINVLKLILPEEAGYQRWFEQMLNGQFLHLTQLHYRLPNQWIDETDTDYQNRVAKTLNTIHNAICDKKIPFLQFCLIEREVSGVFKEAISLLAAIDKAIENQTSITKAAALE